MKFYVFIALFIHVKLSLITKVISCIDENLLKNDEKEVAYHYLKLKNVLLSYVKWGVFTYNNTYLVCIKTKPDEYVGVIKHLTNLEFEETIYYSCVNPMEKYNENMFNDSCELFPKFLDVSLSINSRFGGLIDKIESNERSYEIEFFSNRQKKNEHVKNNLSDFIKNTKENKKDLEKDFLPEIFLLSDQKYTDVDFTELGNVIVSRNYENITILGQLFINCLYTKIKFDDSFEAILNLLFDDFLFVKNYFASKILSMRYKKLAKFLDYTRLNTIFDEETQKVRIDGLYDIEIKTIKGLISIGENPWNKMINKIRPFIYQKRYKYAALFLKEKNFLSIKHSLSKILENSKIYKINNCKVERNDFQMLEYNEILLFDHKTNNEFLICDSINKSAKYPSIKYIYWGKKIELNMFGYIDEKYPSRFGLKMIFSKDFGDFVIPLGFFIKRQQDSLFKITLRNISDDDFLPIEVYDTSNLEKQISLFFSRPSVLDFMFEHFQMSKKTSYEHLEYNKHIIHMGSIVSNRNFEYMISKNFFNLTHMLEIISLNNICYYFLNKGGYFQKIRLDRYSKLNIHVQDYIFFKIRRSAFFPAKINQKNKEMIIEVIYSFFLPFEYQYRGSPLSNLYGFSIEIIKNFNDDELIKALFRDIIEAIGILFKKKSNFSLVAEELHGLISHQPWVFISDSLIKNKISLFTKNKLEIDDLKLLKTLIIDDLIENSYNVLKKNKLRDENDSANIFYLKSEIDLYTNKKIINYNLIRKNNGLLKVFFYERKDEKRGLFLEISNLTTLLFLNPII